MHKISSNVLLSHSQVAGVSIMIALFYSFTCMLDCAAYRQEQCPRFSVSVETFTTRFPSPAAVCCCVNVPKGHQTRSVCNAYLHLHFALTTECIVTSCAWKSSHNRFNDVHLRTIVIQYTFGMIPNAYRKEVGCSWVRQCYGKVP